MMLMLSGKKFSFRRCAARAALPAALLLAGVPAASAAPNARSVAEIDVVFGDTEEGGACSSATITSSKEISNVVLVFEDGSFQKLEAGAEPPDGFMEGQTGLVVTTGAPLTTIYVKSGSGTSGKVEGLPGRVGKEFSC